MEAAIKLLCQSPKILNGDVNLARQLGEWLQDKMVVGKLRYRATADGWRTEDFHRKCDDVGPTVTLVKCGISVFGGFTEKSWKRKRIYVQYNFSVVNFVGFPQLISEVN